MPTRTARLETAQGQKYLTQLCKHFGHKVAAHQEGSHGRVDLPPGPAVMRADPEGLTLWVSAADGESLDRAAGIIGSHLVRFAFREGVDRLDWTDAPEPV